MGPLDQPRDVVYIVEDDDVARALYCGVVRSMGLDFEAFARAVPFLECCDALRPGCLVLDLVLPDLSGLAVQRELTLRGITIPIIFVTGKGQITSAVAAMRQGAFNFLEKSIANAELVENIRQAIALDHCHRRMTDQVVAIREKLESLTKRESDVLNEVISGQSNKIIANKLHLSQRSIELHRSRIMEKMGATSVAQLVRMLLSVKGQDESSP